MLLICLNLGYAIALIQILDQTKSVIWVCISAYLAVTAIFYAAMLGDNTQARLRWLLHGYLAAAVLASLAGIAGYLQVSDSLTELFLRYGRARGTFNDPNVLGAFLVLPGMLLLQRVLAGRRSQFLWSGMLLIVLMGGLFLSFSRAAWGQFGLCGVLLMAITFVTTRSASERVRIVTIAILGVMVIALFVAALAVDRPARRPVQWNAPRSTRATTSDPWAASAAIFWAPGWRSTARSESARCSFRGFSRKIRTNTFLNSFMSGGWLAGFAYLTLTLVTVVSGLRFLFVATAVAADLSGRLRGLSGCGDRERHHRHRPLAALFPDPRRALGLDGGLAALPQRPAYQPQVA